MEAPRFRVIFAGKLNGKVDKKTARSDFSGLFKLKDQDVARLFSGKSFVIKQDVDQATAEKLQADLQSIGCESDIQPVSNSGYKGEEKRKQGERRTKFRRAPRPGAITPDRRLGIQRKKDRIYFRDLVASDTRMPHAFGSYPPAAGEDAQ